ncbi:hypothetical protein [Bacillus dakarensis]|uniref:hypothetical protein n=1 Tax=Robertmurraya dakarensis TaxID=1926278 RepID=UPI000980D655|nr:hypothetical protein [Bacillus dakarensis]
MGIGEFCGELEFSILQFTFSLCDDINEKIKQKKLFYKEQIDRYVHKRIDIFFTGNTLKKGLLQIYKSEMYNTIMFKLRQMLKEYKILQCL